MMTTSGRCSIAAETAAAPSATEATIWTSSRIPSRSSRASRKTSLSSTRTIRTGDIYKTLFRAEEKRVVRLPALVHLDLELRVGRPEPLQQPVERRRLGAGEEREESARLLEEVHHD